MPAVAATLVRPASPRTGWGWRGGWSIAENPLTARVAVNRYLGADLRHGLVETEEDFGTQGEPPSHPELLDWLAVCYRESGWDTKALLRLIVTSATYRQSSKVTPELLERDPRNRLLARAPRVRLEAEMVRDQALALSGLLCRKLGGPSVFPPQPDGLWQAAFNGQRTWATSQGEDRYRRGLYTFWRRTVPYPSMATFDAPSREICAIKRRPHQHAAAVVRHAQRPGLRRGGAGPGAADRARGGHGRREPRADMACSSAFAGRRGPSRSSRSSALYTAEYERYRNDPDRPRRLWPPSRSGRCRREWSRPSWPPGPRSPTCS